MTGTNDLRKEFQQMLSDSERTKEWDRMNCQPIKKNIEIKLYI